MYRESKTAPPLTEAAFSPALAVAELFLDTLKLGLIRPFGAIGQSLELPGSIEGLRYRQHLHVLPRMNLQLSKRGERKAVHRLRQG